MRLKASFRAGLKPITVSLAKLSHRSGKNIKNLSICNQMVSKEVFFRFEEPGFLPLKRLNP
jgi:hypothetical protein